MQAVALLRRRVGEHERSLGARQPLDVVGLLDQERQAGQRTQARAAGGRGGGRVRFGERFVRPRTDDGVERLLVPRDDGQRPFDQLARRHLSRTDHLGELMQHVRPLFDGTSPGRPATPPVTLPRRPASR